MIFLSCYGVSNWTMASFFKKGQFSDKTINWFPKVTKSSTNSLRADWTKRTVVSWQMVSKLPHDNGVLWNVFCLGWNRAATCRAAVVGGCGVKIFSTVEIRSLYKYRQFYCMIFFLLIFKVLGLPRLLCTAGVLGKHLGVVLVCCSEWKQHPSQGLHFPFSPLSYRARVNHLRQPLTIVYLSPHIPLPLN